MGSDELQKWPDEGYLGHRSSPRLAAADRPPACSLPQMRLCRLQPPAAADVSVPALATAAAGAAGASARSWEQREEGWQASYG